MLVGLGNPGEKYRLTRHNAGFRFLDALAEAWGLAFAPARQAPAEIARAERAGRRVWLAGIARAERASARVWLVRPLTYMNDSGRAVAPLARYFEVPADRIVVAYDDLDLPAGKLRVKKGGGHGGHNGLKSII
ncbi:MAG: peptidyl-tRNA hydrolase, partial [Zetaproteobacteria bacterium]